MRRDHPQRRNAAEGETQMMVADLAFFLTVITVAFGLVMTAL